ncbi:MAG: hypothetical protein IBX61_00790 [Thermoleophilia bacterium]|nr:hypothetical protein [Thermoleophilia bacterium]
MSAIHDILSQVAALGFTLERHGDELHLKRPAGSAPPPELITAIRFHKPELMDHLAFTREQYEALTDEQRRYYQPGEGLPAALTGEVAGQLIEEGTMYPEPGSFEHDADVLLLASTTRIARAWPAGFDLGTDPRWQRADKELHVAYHSGDAEKLRVILELREKLALKLFEAYRKEKAA